MGYSWIHLCNYSHCVKWQTMINLEIKDKYKLNALHKALMEVKFNDNSELIIQSSPMVANVMNNVVDELEKIR